MEKILTKTEKHKIANANWYKANKEKSNAQSAKWRKENPDKVKDANHSFYKENPNYHKEYGGKGDQGYFAVYLIHDHNGLGHDYCGQTHNLQMRMSTHKHRGKLNTETYEVLEKFNCRFEALGFELTMHLSGYHGYNNGQ